MWTLVGLFVLLAWLQWHSRAQVGFVSKAMADRLIRRPASWLPWATLAVWFLSCLCLLLAWMRPQSDGGYELRPQVGAQIMVCLDVSRSMLAEDVAPNRLQRAKADITDLLPYLRGDQVGMIAFAGTATIVSPMTTDFGFLRLLLENLGPHSVGRGGTQLETPLRVAMDGFSPAGDVSRIVLLITDGEDHDSFPLAAAEEAGKRGIRVITMGFGSEAGSTIEYTDPQNGIRTIVRDENDQPVTSRLDGNTLRDIALKTDGAYIPVRTGTIDLKSIYDQHIAPLLRGQLQAGQVKVQHELFQWFVGAGLLLFFVAAGLQGRRPIERPATRVVAWFIGMLIVIGARGSIHAMTSVDPTQTTSSVDTKEGAKETNVPNETSQTKESDGKREAKESPRVVYNRGRALLDSDVEQSEKLLQDAVDHAGNDGTLRFYGYYNLGWLATHRAEEEYSNDQPEKALEQLQRAAERFQQALRIRPEDRDARHNLEIVYLRATQIQDAMDRQKQESLPDQLEQLLTKQRELIQEQAGFLQEAAAADPTEASEQEPIVRQYRQLATRQRLVRSDLEALSQRFIDLAHRLQDEVESGRTPATVPSVPSPSADAPTTEASADQKRQLASQLRRADPHLQAAIQRMGQSRRDLRLRNGKRAFRRASHALEAMKQARDQLRSPGERLQLLLSDAMSLLRLTTLRDATRQADIDGMSEGPSWLSGPLLQESQAATLARTQELRQSMTLADNTTAPEAATTADPGIDWNDVDGILGRAVDYFRESGIALEKEEWAMSVEAQSKGVQALADAADRLLDLKGLLEKVYSQEFVLQHMLESVTQASTDQTGTDHRDPIQLDATVQQARNLQSENHDRMKRLQQKIVDERKRIESEGRQNSEGRAAVSDNTVSPESQVEQEMQRLAIAGRLADQAIIQMSDALQQLSEPIIRDDQKAVVDSEQAEQHDGNPIVQHVKATVETLNELRRLFFSIVEHLAEAAERQATLRDETETLKSEMDQDKLQNELGSRQFRQQELAELTDQLGIALHDMQTSENQSPGDATGVPVQGNGTQGNGTQGTAVKMTAPGGDDQKFVEAGKSVKEAGQAIRQTVSAMEAKPVELSAIGKLQDVALEQLQKAIQILQPNAPRPNEDPQDSNQDEQPDEKSGESSSNDSSEKNTQESDSPPEQNMALQELLQRVRDRDAKRKNNKMRRGAGRESVEKDW
ncbi:MAG: VWA domain-containing protein [Planctomycetota bacterium]|nr:VWA domain-containing protein [Planctomycetota bacterium]